MLRAFVPFALALSIGCREEHGPPAFVVGDVCASPASYCEAWNALVHCSDGRWERVDCTTACDGATMGCLLLGPSSSHASCLCDDDTIAPGTEESTTGSLDACIDPETLVECDMAECTEYACADLCAELADFPKSLGCRAGTCECSAIGAPCTMGEPVRCERMVSLIACLDGIWTATDCRAECRSTLAVCEYDETETAVCECGE